jgi:hypothetical protein
VKLLHVSTIVDGPTPYDLLQDMHTKLDILADGAPVENKSVKIYTLYNGFSVVVLVGEVDMND